MCGIILLRIWQPKIWWIRPPLKVSITFKNKYLENFTVYIRNAKIVNLDDLNTIVVWALILLWLNNTSFSLGKFLLLFHQIGAADVPIWFLILTTYGRKKDLRRCRYKICYISKLLTRFFGILIQFGFQLFGRNSKKSGKHVYNQCSHHQS